MPDREVEALENKAYHLQQEKNELETKYSNLRDEKDRLDRELTILHDDFEPLKQQYEGLLSKLNSYNKENEKKNDEQIRLQRDQYREQFEMKKANEISFQNRIKELERLRCNQDCKSKVDQDTIESLEQKVHDLLTEIDESNKLMANLKRGYERELEHHEKENINLKNEFKEEKVPVIKGFQDVELLFKLKLNHGTTGTIFVKSPSMNLNVELNFPEDILKVCLHLQKYWLSTCYNMHPDVSLFWSFYASRPLAIGYCTGCCNCNIPFFELMKFLKNYNMKNMLQ